MTQKINIVLFGIGKAGSALINKVLKNRKELILENHLDIRFPVITNSTVAFFEKEGANFSWEANFIQFAIPFKLADVVDYIQENRLQNVVVVDATANPELVRDYVNFIRSGFNLVSINETLKGLHHDFEDEVKLAANIHGLSYSFSDVPKGDKELAAEGLFKSILSVAKEQKVLA
jgi:homoserine dehydrogenase